MRSSPGISSIGTWHAATKSRDTQEELAAEHALAGSGQERGIDLVNPFTWSTQAASSPSSAARLRDDSRSDSAAPWR